MTVVDEGKQHVHEALGQLVDEGEMVVGWHVTLEVIGPDDSHYLAPRASKTCSVPGCPELQPCPRAGHRKVPWEGSTRRQGLPKGWERIRRRILRRDRVCRICRAAPSQEVHHLRGPENNSEHALAGVCAACHASATGRQGAAARNASR